MLSLLVLLGVGVYVAASQNKNPISGQLFAADRFVQNQKKTSGQLLAAGRFSQMLNLQQPGSSIFSRSQLTNWAKTLHVGGTGENVDTNWGLLTLDEIAQQGWLAFGNGVQVLEMGPDRWSQVKEATAGLIAWEIFGREKGNFGNAALRLWEIQSWLLYYRWPGTPETRGSFGAKRCKMRQEFTTIMIKAIQAAPAKLQNVGSRSWLLAHPVWCPRPPAVPAVFVGSENEQEQTLESVVNAFTYTLDQAMTLSFDASEYTYTFGDLLKGIAMVVIGVVSVINPAAGAAIGAGVAAVGAAAKGDNEQAVSNSAQVYDWATSDD